MGFWKISYSSLVSEECATIDLRVVSWSPMFGVEITHKNKVH